MLNKQKIAPLIKNTISPATLIYTDEYGIYARLVEWGYKHKHVNHGQGEYARDKDEEAYLPTAKRVLASKSIQGSYVSRLESPKRVSSL